MRLVFLIGYRGTGKTTVAGLLAAKLNWSWCDADMYLEKRYGRTIRQIFVDEGEAGFRDKEAAILDELSRGKNLVVATGGGVILRPENRTRLRAGKVVWLTAPADVLWERLQSDATTAERRPNLGQGGLAEIEELLRMRTPLYEECADWRIDSAKHTPDQVVEQIYQWLEGSPAPDADTNGRV